MKKLLLPLLLAITVVSIGQTKQYPNIDIPFKKFTLANGLTLIVHEDHKVPIASFNIWYHVGSKNEKPGKTGFAHLFEHIMFTTTEHWKNFDEVMQTVGGGNNNGTTNNDRTNYFETFTKKGLDRVLWLEADRMGFLLKGLDSGKIDIQRGVVQNEKRQGENRPYSIGWDLVNKNTYPAGHPYSWTVIGSMEDLNAASVSDVKEWFKTYYGPNNATVSIAGDVQADEVFEKVKKYFGDIPASPPINKHSEWIAKMSGTHYQVAQDRVPQARLMKVWNTPAWGTKEITYLDLLTSVLTNGKSSRLYKRLVYDNQLASNVFSFVDDKEIGGQFFIVADAKPGVELSKINEIINEEMQKVLTLGLTSAEVERAKTTYFLRFIEGLERSGGFGGTSDVLAQSQTYGGTPDYYKKVQSWIKAATPEDLKKAAKQSLTDGEYVLNILPYPDYTNTASKLDRTAMPPVPTAEPAKFPEVKEFKLSNGLKVYLAERHSVPVVIINTAINAGFAADQNSIPGLAKLAGTMMTEGTTTKTSTQISDILTNLGTRLNVYTQLDDSDLFMQALKTNLEESLNLYADVLLNPSFPQKDFDRVKKEQLLDIKQVKADPQRLGNQILPRLIYGSNHAYGNPMNGLGSEESVQKVERDDLKKFHQKWFAPNNASLYVVGDITETELKLKLEKSLGSWKAHDVPQNPIKEVALAEKPTVYIIDKPGAVQSVISAAEISVSGSDPDFDAINLMNRILGGSFTSRLNMNLREDKHWSYGVGSYYTTAKGPGVFIASGAVQTDKTKESIIEFQKELGQINTTKLISEEEFRKEQTSSVLSVAGDWETNMSIMNALLNAVMFNRGKDYLGRYASMLQNFTVADMQRAAAKAVKPDNLTWLIVGDRSKIEQGIRDLNIGPIKFLDASGTEIK